MRITPDSGCLIRSSPLGPRIPRNSPRGLTSAAHIPEVATASPSLSFSLFPNPDVDNYGYGPRWVYMMGTGYTVDHVNIESIEAP